MVSAQKELLQYIPLINQTDNEKLSRLYESARKPEETFLKAKIPYVIYSGVEFYGRKEIKDVLSYLKMLLHQDDVSFLRTVNEPRRNFGKNVWNCALQSCWSAFLRTPAMKQD